MSNIALRRHRARLPAAPPPPPAAVPSRGGGANSGSSPNNSPSSPPISSSYYPSAQYMPLPLSHGLSAAPADANHQSSINNPSSTPMLNNEISTPPPVSANDNDNGLSYSSSSPLSPPAPLRQCLRLLKLLLHHLHQSQLRLPFWLLPLPPIPLPRQQHLLLRPPNFLWLREFR